MLPLAFICSPHFRATEVHWSPGPVLTLLLADMQATARWNQGQNWSSVSCPQFNALSLRPTAAFCWVLTNILIHYWLFSVSKGWTKSSLAADILLIWVLNL